MGKIAERDPHQNDPVAPELYVHYHRRAVRGAYLILQSVCDAEMVADKVMEELWKLDNLQTRAQIEAYFSQLLRWRTIDCFKSSAYRLRVAWSVLTHRNEEGEEYEVFPLSSWMPSAEDDSEDAEKRQELLRVMRHIEHVLGRLKPRQRACFVYRFVEGLKSEEIAQLLGLPAQVVHTETYRARNRVERFLAEQEEMKAIYEKGILSRESGSSEPLERNKN